MLRFFLFIKGAQRGTKGHKGDGSICALKNIFKIAENKKKGTDRTVPFVPPKNKSRTRGKDTRLYCINERIYQKPG